MADVVTIGRAIEALASGSIVGVPTDTVYGIAADARNEEAVEALFAVKGRSGVKPIPLLCADLDQARTVGVIDDEAGAMVARHWPGGLTVVVRRVVGTPDWLGDPGADTIGLRVPDHPVALDLLGRVGPLAVTSANRSGDDPAIDHIAARAALGDRIAVYLEGRGRRGSPSTVVDLTSSPTRVLRTGAVEWVPS